MTDMVQGERPCPCGVPATYAGHCARIHRSGAGLGTTAESLMRARYSAYVLGLRDFLLESWHPDTRPDHVEFDPAVEWLGLEIVDSAAGGALDNAGEVEFRARFRRGEQHLELHERSSFVRTAGRWTYVAGE